VTVHRTAPPAPNPAVQKVIAAVKSKSSTRANLFAIEWRDAARDALWYASAPADPDSMTYWGIALAGNLVWAATVFVPNPAGLAVKIMSVAGAAVGSGAVEQLTKDRKPLTPAKDPKEIVLEVLNDVKDDMQKGLKQLIESLAAEVAAKNLTDEEAQKAYVWDRIFTVAYEHRSNALYKPMLQTVNAILAQFNAQFAAWKRSMDMCTGDPAGNPQLPCVRALGGPAFRPSLHLHAIATQSLRR
jgi:hypothetical protein